MFRIPCPSDGVAQGDNTLPKKKKMQSKILETLLVEQKTGILAVLSAPLLEQPIQKTLKKAKKPE